MKEKFIFLLFMLSGTLAEFNFSYIGDSLSNDDAAARDFCSTKYCVSDAEILFKAVTKNASVDPCVDFKQFAMGTFIKEQELPENYFAVGLLQQTQRMHEERLQKLLSSSDDKTDPRVFKVMKNFYEKCISTANVIENGKQEIVDYLNSIGGSPILNGDSWDSSQFNLSKVFQYEPFYAVLLLLDYEFKPWSNLDGWNKTHSIPSFIEEGIFSFEDPEKLTYKHYKEMLEEIFMTKTQNSTYREKLEANIDEAVERLKTFGEQLMKHKGTSDKIVLEVKDMKDYSSNLNVNWLQIINDQLLDSMKLTEQDEILIYSPATLKSLAVALETADKGMLADTFVVKFLYAHRFLFIPDPFDWKDAEYTSNTQALPRREQCLSYIKDNMRPALEALLSKESDQDNEKLEKFAKDAINDFTEQVKKLNESILSKDAKEKAVEKLNMIKLSTKSIDKKYLDEYYDELNLKGDENLVQSALEIEKFYKRIKNDYKDLFTQGSKSWLDSAAQADLISYNTLSDELNIPAVWTYYPWYHADRPKFFNQATLYLDIITAVKFNIVRYIENVLHIDALKFHNGVEEFKFAYDNYVEWEAHGGKDLLLRGNRLTNKQLFWLALARSRYRKQKAVPGIEGNDYDRTFFWFKHKYEPLETYQSFKEAFHCTMKQDELKSS